MKETHNHTDSNSNLFLTGSILLANLDYSGLTDYAVKAVIGGMIWMVFKVAGDWISRKVTRNKTEQI
jgi:hypothetical protein